MAVVTTTAKTELPVAENSMDSISADGLHYRRVLITSFVCMIVVSIDPLVPIVLRLSDGRVIALI
jgi:hypothetical protein